jgi:dolichol-phosphate mannosyltransferase
MSSPRESNEATSADPLRRVYVVMPVANEARTIVALLETMLALPFNLTICPVIDSKSTDGTQALIEGVARDHPGRVELLYNPTSSGAPSCYLFGFRYALKNGASAILEMDAGWSHDPAEIGRILEPLGNGLECSFGSRFILGGSLHGLPVYRRILSRGGTIVANAVLGTRLRDMTSGFEAFTSDALRHVDLDGFASQGHFINTEIRYRLRELPSVEVPITYRGSDSSLRPRMVIEALKMLVVLWREKRGKASAPDRT